MVLISAVVVLAVALGYLANQLRQRTTDLSAVNSAGRVDTEGLVTAVKEAVDAQVGKAAQEALKTNTELAGQLIDERTRTLEEQTKNLLQPVTEQMSQLKASVGDLKSTYENNKGSVDRLNESLTQQINELASRTGALAGRGVKTSCGTLLISPAWLPTATTQSRLWQLVTTAASGLI